MNGDSDPPDAVSLTADEALDLLADLEDARDALARGGLLTLALSIESHIVTLSDRLGFEDPEEW